MVKHQKRKEITLPTQSAESGNHETEERGIKTDTKEWRRERRICSGLFRRTRCLRREVF